MVVIVIILFLKEAHSKCECKIYRKVKITMTHIINQNMESNTYNKKTMSKLQCLMN